MTTSSPIRSPYDVVVVGARCAGAATAMQMARRGLRVLAVERAAYGSDSLSTLALMRPGVLQLSRWGLLERLRAEGTPPVRSTTFHYGAEPPIELEIRPRDGVDALYAPRRTVLDRVLADAAIEAGAEVAFQTRVTDLVTEGRRVVGVIIEDGDGHSSRVEAGLVVGADGVRSTVARSVGAVTEVTGRNDTATVYGYWRGIDAPGYRWYYRPGLAAGSIPTDIIPANGRETLVFATVAAHQFARLRKDRSAGYHEVLHAVDPELASEVSGAEQSGRLWGFAGQVGYYRRSHGPGWALVGDAGYFKDPLTAHGMSDALRDAELLASCFAHAGEAGLAQYQNARDELTRPVFDLTDRIASFDWDLAELKQLHLELSREMNHEVDVMKTWHEAEVRVAA